MELELLAPRFAVCRLTDGSDVELCKPFTFFARTDREISCVCPAESIPAHAAAVEGGWRGLRVSGSLDFALVGVLSKIAAILAAVEISIFVVSTYDTDYLFVKEETLAKAVAALKSAGYLIQNEDVI